AAELKHLKAQTNLALMLWIGRGCEKDQKLALEWIRKAAKDGYEPAMGLLETMRKKQGGI
ncbi:MAG: sel1 repeat family protein, partial [Verrucomicrobiota bacterium]|nr:sel1 repeat family protein [Verrucomicrobiota bacterium]